MKDLEDQSAELLAMRHGCISIDPVNSLHLIRKDIIRKQMAASEIGGMLCCYVQISFWWCNFFK